MIVDHIGDFIGHIANRPERLVDSRMVVGLLGLVLHTSLLYVAFV